MDKPFYTLTDIFPDMFPRQTIVIELTEDQLIDARHELDRLRAEVERLRAENARFRTKRAKPQKA